MDPLLLAPTCVFLASKVEVFEITYDIKCEKIVVAVLYSGVWDYFQHKVSNQLSANTEEI